MARNSEWETTIHGDSVEESHCYLKHTKIKNSKCNEDPSINQLAIKMLFQEYNAILSL